MKSNKILTFALTLGVVGIAGLNAQESLPGNGVRDSMNKSEPASTEIPSSTPKVTDINRLFDNTQTAQPTEESAAPNRNPSVADSLSSTIAQDMSLDASDLVSVDYPNEEIRTVLRNVADLYMLNLVVPDTLVGTTSIKLRDVTWRQIYSVVLEPVGYTFIEDGPIIKVVSQDALNVEPPITEIFMINYAEADSIAATVRNLVDTTKGGQVQVDKRSNALIVSERASRMDPIRTVIDRLDKPTQQVMIETRFLEVNDVDVKNIGVSWTSLRNYKIGTGELQNKYERVSTGDRNKENSDQFNQGDVNFTSGDASVSGNGTSNGRLINNLSGETLVDATAIGRSSVAEATFNRLRGIVNSKTTTALFNASEFGFVLSALKEQADTKLVSNPTVVTLNNQEALISVGDQFPIPAYQYNEETGGFEVSGFEYRDIGIILRVTPSVNHNGLITLKVAPEVSSTSQSVNFGGAGNATIPIIATRRTETQVALKDGYTMGIGGLMESTTIDDQSQVPVLGKIPGIGRLFRHQRKVEDQRNLLIFITASILASEDADFEDVFSEEMMKATGVDPVALKNR